MWSDIEILFGSIKSLYEHFDNSYLNWEFSRNGKLTFDDFILFSNLQDKFYWEIRFYWNFLIPVLKMKIF
jgi:hypothetical protein